MMKQHPDVITVQKKGPNGTGLGTDIQQAIDKAMSSNQHCVVYVPCGLWKLQEPLRLYPPADLTPEVLFKSAILPFAIVDRVETSADGKRRIYLRQVAHAIYQRLDTAKTWDLRIERPSQLWQMLQPQISEVVQVEVD